MVEDCIDNPGSNFWHCADHFYRDRIDPTAASGIASTSDPLSDLAVFLRKNIKRIK